MADPTLNPCSNCGGKKFVFMSPWKSASQHAYGNHVTMCHLGGGHEHNVPLQLRVCVGCFAAQAFVTDPQALQRLTQMPEAPTRYVEADGPGG